MPRHKSHHICSYSQQELFALVIDIESYPKFLPWCKDAKIIKQKDNIIIAKLVIEFSNITQSYISKVTFNQPSKIEVEMIEGPFNYLYNKWSFMGLEDGNTKLKFEIDFKFSSKILENLIGLVFDKSVSKLTDAFLSRAAELYAK